jgi:O-succinylbenzoic acid--CoA ligase
MNASNTLDVNACLAGWIADQPERKALISKGGSLTWRQLDALVNNMSHSLVEQNVTDSDVVALISKNSVELLLGYLSCLRIGAVPALIAPGPANVMLEKLAVLAADAVWLSSDITSEAAGLNATLSCRSLSIELNQHLQLNSDVCDPSGIRSCNDRLSTLASIVFTSGSSGPPKAVAHTAAQHLASAQGLLTQFTFTRSDTWLLSLPMFHVSGLAIVWRWLSVGASIKVGEGKELYSDLTGVTHASLVPTQLKRLLEDGRALSLKCVLLGGSHVPVELAQQAKRRGIDTWLGYGMTEAASTVTAKRVDATAGVGRVLASRKLKVENRRIYIGGETLAAGYYNKGRLTPITSNGWFDSQDLGEIRADELFVLGRADNMFISGGENIHCEEIESALLQHPRIKTAIVVAVDDAEFGARPVAVIQRVEGEKEQVSAKVMNRCLGNLEKFKWPIAYFDMPDSLLQREGIKLSRLSVKTWLEKTYSQYKHK